jgi:fucose permease
MLRALGAANRRLLLLFVLVFIFVGATFTVIGAALPQIIRTFHWTYALTGLVLTATSAGYVLASFLSGFLVERFPPRRIMVIGLVVGCTGMALIARSPSPWLNLLCCLTIGLCQGTLETVMNFEIVQMETGGQSRLMNLLHSTFAVGAILGPLLVGSVISGGLGPSLNVFAAAAVLSVLLAVLVGLSAFPRAVPREKPERGRIRLLRNPLLLALTLFLVLYVGAELGVSTWVAEFFVTALGSSAAAGAFMVSLFWLGLLTGRLLISFLYHGRRQERIILGLTLLSTASLAGTLLVSSPAAVAVGIFITGLGLSGMYPLVMAMVGRIFKSGVAVGAAATGGGLGSLIFPFLIALVAQEIGMRGGFWFATGISGALILLAVVIVRAGRSPGALFERQSAVKAPIPRKGDL